VLVHGLARASIWSFRVHESCTDSSREMFIVSEADGNTGVYGNNSFSRIRLETKHTALYVIQFHVDGLHLQTWMYGIAQVAPWRWQDTVTVVQCCNVIASRSLNGRCNRRLMLEGSTCILPVMYTPPFQRFAMFPVIVVGGRSIAKPLGNIDIDRYCT